VHGPFSQQRQDGRADITATAASAPAAPTTAGSRAETEATARIEAELEAASAAEVWREAGAAVPAQIVAQFATGLPTLFVQRASVERGEAETAGRRWCEGVHQVSLRREDALSAHPIR
jgi:hypothetical protein